jgi:hypothetical protein
MPTQRETTNRADKPTRSDIDSRHIERLLSIDPEGLNLTEKRKTWRKDLQIPLALLVGAIAAIVGGGLAIGGIDIVAWVFGERSYDHLLVRTVLNGAAVLILLSPLIGLGLSTGPARTALRSLIDWLKKRSAEPRHTSRRSKERGGFSGGSWRRKRPPWRRPLGVPLATSGGKSSPINRRRATSEG